MSKPPTSYKDRYQAASNPFHRRWLLGKLIQVQLRGPATDSGQREYGREEIERIAQSLKVPRSLAYKGLKVAGAFTEKQSLSIWLPAMAVDRLASVETKSGRRAALAALKRRLRDVQRRDGPGARLTEAVAVAVIDDVDWRD